MWTRPSCLNNHFYYFIFYTVSYFSETVCVCSVTYICIVPHSWKLFFCRNSFRENFLCIHLSQRERKRHRVVRRVRTLCASSSCCRSFYLRRQTSVDLKAPQIVWWVKSALRRLCQTQDLILFIHPSRS